MRVECSVYRAEETGLDLDALGNIGDFLGGIGVVVTLIYLAFQIRQNTKVVQISSATSRAEQRARQSEFIATTPEINRIFWAGLEEPESLSESEYRYFESIFASYFQGVAAGFDLRRERAVSTPEWEAQVATVEWLMAKPGWHRYWETWRAQYPTDFGAIVDDLIRASEASSVR
jgi:hypothetical protein